MVQQRLRLQQVDDVDAVSLAIDETAHLGVPATRLVAEVDAGLQQLPDSDVSHCYCSLFYLKNCRPHAGARGPRVKVGRDPRARGRLLGWPVYASFPPVLRLGK